MVTPARNRNERPAWFVGAAWGGNDDQTERFLRDGIWENGYTDGKYLGLVSDIRPGDRIAIKSAYVRSNADGLPFDNRGHAVSVMAIKAIGNVTRNMGDGRRLQVEWTRVDPPREWYFSTLFQTVHRIVPDDWKKQGLIAFTFHNASQDIDQFRNDPQWRDKFGERNLPHLPRLPNQPMPPEPVPALGYGIDNIIADGCFLPQPTLDSMLHRLQAKQNLILQGPPGTGKTWLAKKLAYALIGRKDDGKVRPMQFHPNLSYEDFVRGWRPQGDGRLELVDGPFLQVVEEAREHPSNDYVMVIEEINGAIQPRFSARCSRCWRRTNALQLKRWRWPTPVNLTSACTFRPTCTLSSP